MADEGLIKIPGTAICVNSDDAPGKWYSGESTKIVRRHKDSAAAVIADVAASAANLKKSGKQSGQSIWITVVINAIAFRILSKICHGGKVSPKIATQHGVSGLDKE